MEVSTAFFNLLKQQKITDILDMVTLLTKKLKRNLRVIMSPRRIAYMVCLARVSKNLIIEVLIDTTGQRLISINQPTIMVSIMANNQLKPAML